ncbi:MAG: uroporphyrinogen decarboxylase family protein [Candidatus Humimicrobiaceae bacterium]
MKNYERFVKTINFECPDQILTYDFVDSKRIFKAYSGENGDLVEKNARMAENIGLDVTRFIYDPENHWMGAKIENWIRFFGINPENWKVSQAGGTAWISKRPFNDLKGLEKNMPNSPKKNEIEEWYKPYIKHVKEVYDAYGIVFIGAVEGPITDAYTYCGMSMFCEAIYTAPEIIDELMRVTCMFSEMVAENFVENASAPLLFMGEDIAGSTGSIFNPSWLLEKALPLWKRIMRPVKEKGFKFLYHSDGRMEGLLPIIFDELGADGFNPIERNGCNDIFAIRKKYPKKLLFGNVCCTQTLPHGTVEDVERETLELILRIGPEGGICIGSSSEVHDLVPPENALKMYETVHKYGKYPIDKDRVVHRLKKLCYKN